MNKIGPEIEDYVATRILPDGRIIGAHRLLFHWTLHIDISEWGYEDRYCYMHFDDLMDDLNNWNGIGDPSGKGINIQKQTAIVMSSLVKFGQVKILRQKERQFSDE